MSDYKFSFEKLTVWQKSRLLVSEIYEITKEFPESEKYGLINQMRRASVSIMANIAEGSSRISKKDQANFYQIAFSSATEVMSHLYIAYDLNYINDNTLEDLKEKILEITNMLNSLRKSRLNK